MKVWLNDLKEGDIFYHILLDNIYKCEHLGNANNMNFKMSRIKFKILDEHIINKDILGNIHEAFVNQYVYTDYDSAFKELKEKLNNDLESTLNLIFDKKSELDNLERKAKHLKKLILKYAEQDMVKNIK